MSDQNPAEGQNRPNPPGEGEQNATPEIAAAGPCPGSKLKLADIAADWGTSVAYVSKQKGRGCPVDSLESAREWRATNSARGQGYRSQGRPSLPSGGEGAGGNVPPPPASGRKAKFTSIHHSLKAAIEMEAEAHRQVQSAIEAREDARLQNLIAAYNKARDGRYDAEKAVKALLLEERTLIPFDEAKKVTLKVLGTLFSRLRGVARRAAPQANPADDLLAESVINGVIEEVITEVHGEANAAGFL